MAGEADATHALEALENSLRLAIRSVLVDSWETVFDSEKMSRIVARQDEDRRRRHGAIVNDDRLAYTELHDLHTIIAKRWADGFKDIFDDKRRFDVYLETVEGLRNVDAHNRQFLPFEVDLISGISGRIRNQVTLSRSSQDPASQFYPVIESVTDSFGQAGSATSLGSYRGSSAPPGTVRLELGDSVTFTCEGRDARGRELEWVVWPGPGLDFDPFSGLNPFGEPVDASRPPEVLVGDRVSLTWVADVVTEGYALGIVLRVKDSPFHLGADDFANADDIRYFMYAVNPPV